MKPKHLGPEYAAQFQDAAVVSAYPTRPPYPQEVFNLLAGLMRNPRSEIVLDVGCGTGDIARRLARLVSHVDALDISRRMIDLGRTLPGGDAPNVRWIVGAAELVPLEPPYALITAGESLHWMDWPTVLPRLGGLLAPDAFLALVERAEVASPWWDDLIPLFARYSTNRDFQTYDLTAELTTRGFFTKVGEQRTAPMPFEQSVADYIESIHSRNGFSRDRMAPDDATAFDTGVREVVTPYARNKILQLSISAIIVWGTIRSH